MVIFWSKFKMLWQHCILIFRCTISVGVLLMKKKSIFCTNNSEKYGSDKGSVTHGQTDGRTDGRTEEQYMSPANGYIITRKINQNTTIITTKSYNIYIYIYIIFLQHGRNAFIMS